MMKQFKTKSVDSGDYVIYWNKAEEFYETMQHAYKSRMWTAVGLNAVHCAVSLCDALLVKSQGIRSTGEGHLQVVELLSRAPIPGVQKRAAAVRRIVAKKNVVAYENREFRASDATDIFKQIERFHLWAFEALNKK